MLTVGFNNVLSKGTALKGTVAAGTTLGVSIYPQLPSGVVTSAYFPNLPLLVERLRTTGSLAVWFQFAVGIIVIV